MVAKQFVSTQNDLLLAMQASAMQVVAVVPTGDQTQGGVGYGGAMGITPAASPNAPSTPREGPPNAKRP